MKADTAAVIAAARVHRPTTIKALAWDCCNGDCDHEINDVVDECPELEVEVCAACLTLYEGCWEADSYPAEILADHCAICAAVAAWEANRR